jgi:S-adenosylmethionine decarboxylase proenzyme
MPSGEHPRLYSADLSACALLTTLSAAEIEALFIAALTRAGATVVKTVAHHFPGAGLTCTLILAESHATLHTWPETGMVNLDIFSCSPRLQSLAAIDELARAFGAAHVAVQDILRADGRQHPALTR